MQMKLKDQLARLGPGWKIVAGTLRNPEGGYQGDLTGLKEADWDRLARVAEFWAAHAAARAIDLTGVEVPDDEPTVPPYNPEHVLDAVAVRDNRLWLGTDLAALGLLPGVEAPETLAVTRRGQWCERRVTPIRYSRERDQQGEGALGGHKNYRPADEYSADEPVTAWTAVGNRVSRIDDAAHARVVDHITTVLAAEAKALQERKEAVERWATWFAGLTFAQKWARLQSPTPISAKGPDSRYSGWIKTYLRPGEKLADRVGLLVPVEWMGY